MGTSRTVPGFYKKDRFEFLGLAAAFPLLGGLFCCFVTVSTPKHTFSDWSGSLIFLLLGVGLLLTGIAVFNRATSIFRETRSWFKNTATAQTTIVDRKVVDNEVDETARYYGNTGPDYSYYLTLKMVPSQLAIYPNESLVSLNINESQYKRYEDRTSVTIYYSTTDPFVFLLEDEI